MLHNDTGNGVSAVLYVHCEAGEDRTGEVSGAYYMQYLRWTFLDALSYDDHIEARNIQPESMHALQWYVCDDSWGCFLFAQSFFMV